MENEGKAWKEVNRRLRDRQTERERVHAIKPSEGGRRWSERMDGRCAIDNMQTMNEES